MSAKFLLYLVMTPLVLWSLEAVNTNGIFKKNRVVQARIFYFLLGFALIYLTTNFIYDIFESSKIIF